MEQNPDLENDKGSDGPHVLVTGGSGFIGSHCIVQLLAAGYRVRTTLRSMARESEVRRIVRNGGTEPGEMLSFVEADLLSDNDWDRATKGCEYVLHLASPFPTKVPKREDELILPAREGALRVLRAARDAKVKRVVLTSSFAAIGYGHPATERPFTEETWTNTNSPNVTAYVKSKALAERAAWDFIAREGGSMELSVINPVGVFGPLLGPDYSASIELVKRLMDGSMPGCPRMSFGVVDVRDVAALHLKAMIHPAAKGERFLAVSGNFMTIQEMAKVLKDKLGPAAKKVPTRLLPDWLLRIGGIFDSSIAQLVPELGKFKNASSEKAKRILGWNPRSNEEAIKTTGESLLSLHLIKN
jgi:nucleoside-diphosphate-sugar epimerase